MHCGRAQGLTLTSLSFFAIRTDVYCTVFWGGVGKESKEQGTKSLPIVKLYLFEQGNQGTREQNAI